MRRLMSAFLVALVGCATTGGVYLTPHESAARIPLRERAVPMVERLLRRDGWTGVVGCCRWTGTLAPNVSEGWSEDTALIDVTATADDGRPVLVPTADYTPMLETLRRRLRDLVEDHGGGQVDWHILEGFHERTLEFRYKQGDVAGLVRVRVAPKSEAADELITRVEFTVREQ